jgi:multidrug resistance protein, MATE family
MKQYFPYYKRNLLLALPVMLSQAGQVLVQQVDNMMVGSVGTIELAAASFAGNVFIIGMVLSMGFSFGLTPLVGPAWASGDDKLAGKWLHNSVFLNSIISLLLMLAMFSVSFFMDRMGQDDEVVKLAIPYYRILVISILPFMIFFTFKQFAEGIGSTIYAMAITLIANIINICFNYLFIFGKFGFPELGLTGAGIGTLIARVIMPILFIYLFVRKDLFRKYLINAYHSFIDKQTIKRLFEVGWPISIQIVLEVLAFALGAIMIGWLGPVNLAAHQIAIGLASVTFMIATGISSGTTIRVSHQFNLGDYDSMKKASYASVHLVLAFMSTSAILFYIFRNQLPYIYTQDLEVIEVASKLLVMAAIFQVFDGLQVVMLGALRGLTDVKYAMVIAFISYILISLPLSYFLAFTMKWGPEGVWVGFVVSLAIAGILFLRRFNKQAKLLN